MRFRYWRGMSRRYTLVALVLLLVVAALPARAQETTTEDDLYPLVFPVVGENTYSDTFGAPRSGGRTHEGTDILADKMVPIVAAASGTVGWINNEQGGDCCHMAIDHEDGWSTWYIHMNNDTPGTDDGQGWGFADGINSGVSVEAGQLIGWVGDSGNAEETVSHLHFELRDPNGVAINAYEALLAASVLDEPGGGPVEQEPGGEAPVSTFLDIDDSVHADNILRLAELGITGGCEPGLYCPDNAVTRAQMATFLVRALGLDPLESDSFDDDNGSTHEANIEALAAAEITLGCGDRAYCPNDGVNRAQMATFLVRALDLAASGTDSFDDDNGSTHEANIEALAAAEITLGCGDRAYCPSNTVTRAQMATFLIRAIDGYLSTRPDAPLVPAAGVLVGASVDDGDVASYETSLGRDLDVVASTFDGEIDFVALEAVAAAGQIPLVSWTPGTAGDGLLGNLDAYVSEAAADFAAMGSPVFLRYWPGLDGAVAEAGDAGLLWNAAWDSFDAAQADNVVWVWAPDVLDESTVPGPFDWISAEIYGDVCAGGSHTEFATPLLDLAAAADVVGNHPLMVSSWGVGPVDGDPAAQADFVASIGPALADHSQVAALIAHEGETDCDWRLDGTDAMGALAELAATLTVDREALLTLR